MTFDEVVRQVSLDLNDQVPGYEFTRWTQAQLGNYICEALGNISLVTPDLFTTRCTVKVIPGVTWQKACENCTSINKIVGESDADGNITNYLSEALDNPSNVWAGPVRRCPVSPKDYQMTGYTISATKPDEFQVFPPVPPGQDRWVVVECFAGPKCGDDVPWQIVAAVKQWALYRALIVDAENNTAIIQVAEVHHKTYNELVAALVLERKNKSDASVRTVQNTKAD